jgi:hypothetical protein
MNGLWRIAAEIALGDVRFWLKADIATVLNDVCFRA